MNVDEYQRLAARTLNKDLIEPLTAQENMLVWCAVGLAGESGEVLEYVKKVVFHRHPGDLDKLEKELGDVLWYLSGICTVTGIDLGSVMQQNINKLQERYKKHFTVEESHHD